MQKCTEFIKILMADEREGGRVTFIDQNVILLQ